MASVSLRPWCTREEESLRCCHFHTPRLPPRWMNTRAGEDTAVPSGPSLAPPVAKDGRSNSFLPPFCFFRCRIARASNRLASHRRCLLFFKSTRRRNRRIGSGRLIRNRNCSSTALARRADMLLPRAGWRSSFMSDEVPFFFLHVASNDLVFFFSKSFLLIGVASLPRVHCKSRWHLPRSSYILLIGICVV